LKKKHVITRNKVEIQLHKVESFDRTSSDALGDFRERAGGGKLVYLLREKDPGAARRNCLKEL
jgi:hypothetical protein